MNLEKNMFIYVRVMLYRLVYESVKGPVHTIKLQQFSTICITHNNITYCNYFFLISCDWSIWSN